MIWCIHFGTFVIDLSGANLLTETNGEQAGLYWRWSG